MSRSWFSFNQSRCLRYMYLSHECMYIKIQIIFGMVGEIHISSSKNLHSHILSLGRLFLDYLCLVFFFSFACIAKRFALDFFVVVFFFYSFSFSSLFMDGLGKDSIVLSVSSCRVHFIREIFVGAF